MNLPTSYRGIIRLTKKLGINLHPSHCVQDITKKGTGCVLSVLAYANGLDTYVGTLKYVDDPKMNAQMSGLESGFEGWSHCDKSNGVYNRYYKVGARLREYYKENK